MRATARAAAADRVALARWVYAREEREGLTKVLKRKSRWPRAFGGCSAVLSVIQSWRTSANVDIATLATGISGGGRGGCSGFAHSTGAA